MNPDTPSHGIRAAGRLFTATITRTTAHALACIALALPVPPTAAQTTRPARPDTGQEPLETDQTDRSGLDWLPFPDDSKFTVRGLHWFSRNRPDLWRLPKEQFDDLPAGVKRRCKAPSGGRIALRCSTSRLGLNVTPLSQGSLKGFDVYINGSFFRSAVAEQPGARQELVLFKDFDRKSRDIVIYLPYHQEVVVHAVGVDRNTRFETPAHAYARPLPVVFYGSSVCQGSGASRPGMTYEAILCRELNLDFINLGFGGAGKAEKTVVDLVNSIPACCYVFDLGKSYGMQDKTAYQDMLQTVRISHPRVPIICITPITSSLERHSADYAQKSAHTRKVVQEAVSGLMQAGEKNVYLIDGTELLGFDEHDGLSRDGVHPSDYGFGLIARKLAPIMKQALDL